MDETQTIILGGVECDYDPATRIALVYCAHCSEQNAVEVWLAEDKTPQYAGFVCEKCGFFNTPEG
jgi:DNA-directed RNA polymerase subunit RPC12/RpoP